MRKRVLVLALFLMAPLFPTSPASSTAPARHALVSVFPDGFAAGGSYSDISADGRFVVFQSPSQLAGSDANNKLDVYVYDRYSEIAELVSADAAGQAVGGYDGRLSPDGRYVVFLTQASLVSADLGGEDLYMRDRQNGVVRLVSDGNSAEAESFPDFDVATSGRFVVFSTWRNLLPSDGAGLDVYLRDMEIDGFLHLSPAQAGFDSKGARISPDGRYVVFQSQFVSWPELTSPPPPELFAECEYGDPPYYYDTRPCYQIFRHDTASGQKTLVSVSSVGTPGDSESSNASISDDGSKVVFDSKAQNLGGTGCIEPHASCVRGVYMRDIGSGSTQRVSVGSNGSGIATGCFYPDISGQANRVSFLCVSASTSSWELYLRDLPAAETRLVSGGDPRNPRLNADGQQLSYHTGQALSQRDRNIDLSDVYVFDDQLVLTADPDLLTFGMVILGNSANLETRLTNQSPDAISIGDIGVVGPQSSAFTPGGLCEGSTLPTGASCDVSVSFSPTTAGLSLAWLVIESSSSSSPHRVLLEGTAREPFLRTSVSPSLLTFRTEVDRTQWRVVFVSNNGEAPVQVLSVSLSGTGFARGEACDGRVLAVGEYCSIAVAFSPDSAGTYDGSLRIDTSVPETKIVALEGTAVEDLTPPQVRISGQTPVIIGPVMGELSGTADDNKSGIAEVWVVYTDLLGARTTVSAELFGCSADLRHCSWRAPPPAIPGWYGSAAVALDRAGNSGTSSGIGVIVI